MVVEVVRGEGLLRCRVDWKGVLRGIKTWDKVEKVEVFEKFRQLCI